MTMKFGFEASTAFERAARVASLSTARPEFSSVRVDAVDGAVSLTAMSDGLWFRSSVPAVGVVADSSFTVPSALAAETFRRMSEEGAAVEVSDEMVVVSSGRSRYRMRRTSVGDAVSFPSEDAAFSVELDRADLFEHIAAVLPAASRDSSLGVLGAVRFEFGPGGMDIVATDSLRLASVHLPLPSSPVFSGRERAFLLGSREVALLPKIFGRTDKVSVAFPARSDSWVEFSDGTSRLRFAVIAGEFPAWRTLVQAKPDFEVAIDPSSFAELLSGLIPYGKTVTMELSDGSLKASASADAGDVTSSIDALKVSGSEDERSARFRALFLADAVRSMASCGEIRMFVGSERSPLWMCAGPRTHLVMPLSSGI